MNFEVELREELGRDPLLSGVMLQEGRAAVGGRAELFAPGAVEWPGEGIGIATEHLGKVETRAQVVRERDGSLRVTALATDAVKQAIADGKRWLSVEFIPLAERTTRAGVREIQRALVATAAMVSDPEYDLPAVEVRSSVDDIERRARIWL